MVELEVNQQSYHGATWRTGLAADVAVAAVAAAMEACRSVAGRNRPGTAGQLRVLPLGIADDSLDIHAEGSPSFGMAYPDAEHKAAWVVLQAWALVGMGRH
jgi:hypothetical protein